MYNPDALVDKNTHSNIDSPEISCSPDRQEKIEKLYNHLCKQYGVTRCGDRLTVREFDDDNKMYQIEMVILEVELDRDIYRPENR